MILRVRLLAYLRQIYHYRATVIYDSRRHSCAQRVMYQVGRRGCGDTGPSSYLMYQPSLSGKRMQTYRDT